MCLYFARFSCFPNFIPETDAEIRFYTLLRSPWRARWVIKKIIRILGLYSDTWHLSKFHHENHDILLLPHPVLRSHVKRGGAHHRKRSSYQMFSIFQNFIIKTMIYYYFCHTAYSDPMWKGEGHMIEKVLRIRCLYSSILLFQNLVSNEKRVKKISLCYV